MEKLFHDFTMTRRQAGMFKICMLSVGIILGVYLAKYLKKIMRLRWVLFLGFAIYLVYLYFIQAPVL